MLFIQHNLLAQNANRQLNVNTDKNAKTTEKLSSGYKINRAADDAAGLSISEKMRRQIRGLMQGTANAKDGISYVQVADGAMNEGHDILQRMNELALKSLNGTLTEADRAMLNAEFDQLRTEIDRINTDTEYNGRKVFDEHEPSFYQILGNRKWDDNQLHTVSSTENELIINLPDDYVPNEYTLTVPAGIYTTQELVDEIDDALENMTPPNPGFVFEYTDKGYCNLNFEGANGMPTEIASVEGSLAYLLYDLYGGSSTGDLLGTSSFPMRIHRGYNDELGFYIESTKGIAEVSITIPEGSYTREAMINKINEELKKYPNAAGAVAKEYGDSNIQITGGKGVSITGLKGNMFRWECNNNKYSSVFYDNVHYVRATSKSATISGYNNFSWDAVRVNTINIKAGENDTLRFKLNGADSNTEIKIPEGEYTILGLASELNVLLKDKGVVAQAVSTSYGYFLRLSSELQGSKSKFEFDRSGVYGSTYDSLFCITRYYPNKENGQAASLTGVTVPNGTVILNQSDSLTIDVDGKTCTITGIGGSYSIDQLAPLLNDYLKQNSSELADKIQFVSFSNYIKIEPKETQVNNVAKIRVTYGNSRYKQLFEGTTTKVKPVTASKPTTGKIEYGSQGEGNNETITPASFSVNIPADKQTGKIQIEGGSNILSFRIEKGNQQGNSNSFSYSYEYPQITLDPGSYTIQELKDQIQSKLPGNMTVSYSNGQLTFESTPLADRYTVELYNTGLSTIWKNIYGTENGTTGPDVQDREETTLTTAYKIDENITLNGSNNTLTLNIGSGDVTINIAQGSYSSRTALRDAVQSAINANSALNGKVTVSLVDDKLCFSTSGALTASGSFYDAVIITETRGNATLENGTYKFGDTSDPHSILIIGRKDVTEEPVEIISDANDRFVFNFTHCLSTNDPPIRNQNMDKVYTMEVTIPEGTYTGDEIAVALQNEMQKKFAEEKLDNFEVKVTVGGINTNTANNIDDKALQIVVNRKADAEPDRGTYILDGVRGSAASYIFYKTTSSKQTTYITGTKDLTNGVIFEPGKNVLTLSADHVPYKYTFPENVFYTADEFVALLNDKFTNGDDNGNTVPLTASIENGVLKLTYRAVGSHTITDVGGSARSTVFFQEKGRDSREELFVQVTGEPGNHIEIPKVSVGSCAIRINSITISRPKYAEKAVRRIKEAINSLSSKRSTYGALQNRMEHTVNNNNNIIENTQASESAIRDADIADLMMEFSINNILLQAGSSMLAQANQSSQLLLELLR